MTDLFLIAHKVRSEPAFDVAVQMECPECADKHSTTCTECDSLGYWWICPTSGHRAYPVCTWDVFNWPIDSKHIGITNILEESKCFDYESLPDHYHHTSSPATIRIKLLDMLANLQPPPTKPFKRRF